MDKEEILYWKKRYDDDFGDPYIDIEKLLHNSFQEKNFMTKKDLERIIKWKFQGQTKGRQIRLLRIAKDVREAFIINVSKSAFGTDSDVERIRLLTTIDGVGVAVASVILTFYDPRNYGIFDIHVWRELFGEEPRDLFSSPKYFKRFLEKIREYSSKYDLPCRDIEKALFRKNIE